MFIHGANMTIHQTAGADDPKARKEKKPDDPAALRAEFWASPDDALFPRETLAAVRRCTVQNLEIEAIKGGGIPYRRIGRRAFYSKGDYRAWVEAQGPVVRNTAQLPQTKPRNFQTLTEATA